MPLIAATLGPKSDVLPIRTERPSFVGRPARKKDHPKEVVKIIDNIRISK